MTKEIDIYRSAQVLIREHGEDAPIHAAMRADELMAAGDMNGQAVWKRILAAVSPDGYTAININGSFWGSANRWSRRSREIFQGIITSNDDRRCFFS